MRDWIKETGFCASAPAGRAQHLTSLTSFALSLWFLLLLNDRCVCAVFQSQVQQHLQPSRWWMTASWRITITLLYAFSLFTVLPCLIMFKQHCTGLWQHREPSCVTLTPWMAASTWRHLLKAPNVEVSMWSACLRGRRLGFSGWWLRRTGRHVSVVWVIQCWPKSFSSEHSTEPHFVPLMCCHYMWVTVSWLVKKYKTILRYFRIFFQPLGWNAWFEKKSISQLTAFQTKMFLMPRVSVANLKKSSYFDWLVIL